ncbi:MAG: glycosyltransferase family 9 protein [Proteobacteria bacterium]|nr:glycosyltransferase family 9 protein [Pseudomonadota bacterium]
MRKYRKIGVWQTAFLGDAVLTLPLIRALKDAYPEAELHFFVRGGVEPLFAPHKDLASVTGFYKRSGQKSLRAAQRFGREIGSRGFDLWVSTHASLRSALVARSTAIPERIGYDAPWFNKLAYTHAVARRFSELEEIERLMQLAIPLGIEGEVPWPELDLAPAAIDAAQSFFEGLDRLRPGAPVLGVHPGSTWPTKKWPLGSFAEILRRAVESGATVAVFGGPGEEADAAEVIRLSGMGDLPQVVDLSGMLDLPTLAAYIKRLTVYLTNDSGPMHLAWIQRTPTVAVFGPTVRELGFFPRGETATVMEVADLDCRPCGLHGPKRCPKGHHDCMMQLTPDMVWGVLQKKLCK